MAEWKLYAKEMPKNEQEVLVTLKAGTTFEGEIFIHNSVHVATFVNDQGETYDGIIYPHFVPHSWSEEIWSGEVIAWMPIPEPYQDK